MRRRPFACALAAFAIATAPALARAQDKCAMSAAEVYRAVAPSVVQVMSFQIDPYRVIGRVRAGTGTGISLGDGYVLTNYHVVTEAKGMAVSVDGAIVRAKLVGRDPTLDIAVLSAPDLPQEATPIEIAPEDAIEVGQSVFVVGYPLGIGKSIASGIVSGLGRVIPLNTSSWLSPFIQTDAAVSAGNSGGPLVDACGRMVGMVSLRSQHPQAENMGYAIPAKTITEELGALIDDGKVARPWHGLYGQMVSPPLQMMFGMPSVQGFLVETVEPGSAADKAGIRGGTLPVMWGMHELILGGDVITEVNGAPILTMEDAIAAVRALKIGDTVEITLLRGTEEIHTSAKIEERPVLDRDLEIYRQTQ